MVVEIKGYRGQLSLVIDEATPFPVIQSEVKELLQKDTTKSFFQGSTIYLQPGANLQENEVLQLKSLFQSEGDMFLETHFEKKQSKQSSFLEADESTKPIEESLIDTPSLFHSFNDSSQQMSVQEKNQSVQPSTFSLPEETETTLMENSQNESESTFVDIFPERLFVSPGVRTESNVFLSQTLRSGQKVISSKTVILLGDLNAGAEIISEKDILVFGTIRGMVHAGAAGDKNAVVIAMKIQPTQIRISELIVRPSLEDQKSNMSSPEIARIEDNQIIVDYYQKRNRS